jgi:phytanoyl-CoA hydroxylase
MTLTADQRFEFDVQGYVHIRGALRADEIATYQRWIDEVQGTDVKALNADYPEGMAHQLNRPVSRMMDADPRFACLLDHPVVVPYMVDLLGEDYRHIDNDLFFTYPGYTGGGWHRGVSVHPTGHVENGEFVCSMVKAFFCMTDVGPGEGEFVIVPGSHRAMFEIDMSNRIDLPLTPCMPGTLLFLMRACYTMVALIPVRRPGKH